MASNTQVETVAIFPVEVVPARNLGYARHLLVKPTGRSPQSIPLKSDASFSPFPSKLVCGHLHTPLPSLIPLLSHSPPLRRKSPEMMSHDLRGTLGAALIGSAFAATFVIPSPPPEAAIALTRIHSGFSLTGVVATQTLYYFQIYPDDKPSVKLTVSLMLLTYRPMRRLISR